MTTPELLPCPLCGNEASHNGGGGSCFGRFWWTVGCKTCDIWVSDPEVWDKKNPGMLDPAYPAKWCIAAWNRRTPSPEVAALSAERAALKTDVTTYQAMVMDLTAEGEALRAKLAEVTAERSSLSAMFATQAEETQAAKARVAELEALIRGKTFTVDESVELKAENERLRTPQGAAKVLLTISDVEIKPAAKALQDAFNLKGIGWKRYLSALRAAITALQETKP